MRTTPSPALTERILVLAPIGQDAALACQVLGEAGLRGEVCDGLDALCRQLGDGAGAVLLAEEALSMPALERLTQFLDDQPPWSTLPLVVLTRSKTLGWINLEILRTLENRHGVTFLERPVRIMTLISTVQAALETRRRQYQIRDLLQDAEQGIRYRDEFLAMLGHELRNPLAPICNVLEIFKLKDPLAAPTLQWGLEVIDRQVQQLIYLVDDLLDIARVSQGRIELHKETIALNDIVAAAAEAARSLIEARRHELILSLPVRTVQVEADPARLTQVVTNLLQNAAKYTEPQGSIWLTVRREGNEAVISVRDTGIGIPTEFLPQVFEPFTQASRSLARSQGGLGIGLALVRRLVEMHGGRVQAFSAGPGQGSEFMVRLPALATAPSQAEPVQDAHEGGGEGSDRRILVVDDHQDVASALAALLDAIGHTVHTAHDGEAALEAARTFHPQVIFLDIGLPRMDGYEVARRLRKDYGSTVRLIALTGYGQEEDKRRAHEAGFDSHLTKPVDIEELRAMLSS